MGNLSGLLALTSLIHRPSLLIPNVSTNDIRQLDWIKLYESGVRYLVFDKDNCLTKPNSDQLEPRLHQAWSECKSVFGADRILIISNSSGSNDDPSGLGAENLSRILGVPVLRHYHKKPSQRCASEALDYFTSLNPSSSSSSSSSSSQANPCIDGGRKCRGITRFLRVRYGNASSSNSSSSQAVRDYPETEDGGGSILLVGDRTMTDVILAHRMNDELQRRRKAGSSSTFSSSSSSSPTREVEEGMDFANLAGSVGLRSSDRPRPRCISVLTTGIWETEGWFNMWMRSMESKVTRKLIQSGYRPGQKGWKVNRGGEGFEPESSVDWQSLALRPSYPTDSRLGSNVPNPEIQLGSQPTKSLGLGSLLFAAALRPLPRRISSFLLHLSQTRVWIWLANNFGRGLEVLGRGLEIGVEEAKIRGYRERRRRTMMTKTRLGLGSASSSHANPFSSEIGGRKGIERGQRYLGRTRDSIWPFGGGGGGWADTSSSHSSSSKSQRRAYSQQLSGRGGGSERRNPPPPPPKGGKIPLRNWLAAISTFIIVPICFYGGAYLHEISDASKLEEEGGGGGKEEKRPTELEIQAQDSNRREEERQKEVKLMREEIQIRKKSLALSKYHLERERSEIREKLERLRERMNSS
ncbi:hypothetical protein IE53DRAFT_330969 [Violaceomyces palustris]|uniref:Uncharacterized protein n=1 Tax=Violaceomyces palustris TaxID=1673888 RepID=A0ACD0NWA6_9BASI|nr:hypothetical protein IE53DRAFT_330969 [Violaceomyces palustris]